MLIDFFIQEIGTSQRCLTPEILDPGTWYNPYILKVNEIDKISMADKVLTMDSVNPNIVQMEYAVRGPIVARATELEKELANGANKPFTSVMKANMHNMPSR